MLIQRVVGVCDCYCHTYCRFGAGRVLNGDQTSKARKKANERDN
jgi:hypothetical protein